jgi:Flp pilus assembly protein TadD
VNAVYAGEGDFEARILRAKLDTDPSNVEARLALARHYQQRGFPDIALEHCRIACERSPGSVDAHIELAKMLRDQQRPQEGAEALAAFVDANSGDARAWAWLGVLRDEAGDPKAGEQAHRKAVALAPGRDDLLNNLGYSLLQQNRKTEAAEFFRAALKINPESAIARNNLGLAQADNAGEALLDWQAISGPAAAHNNLAASFIETGRYEDARLEIQRALTYDARYAPALNNLELISELDGKPAVVKPAVVKPVSTASKNLLSRISARWRQWTTGGDKQKTQEAETEVASR